MTLRLFTHLGGEFLLQSLPVGFFFVISNNGYKSEESSLVTFYHQNVHTEEGFVKFLHKG